MMRRFMPLSLLIGLAALAATGGNAGWAAGLAVVANSGGASISLIDMQKQVELRRIPALREPHHLTLTPDHRTLVVGDTAGNELLLLDPATGAVRKQVPVSDPYNLGFSPDGKWLTVNGLA
ncbi:MAG: YncE family protein, partial [Acetobacteraceae bacterium]|nr:YncE family protein [Acetobacteraceae bacterium]